MAPAAKKSAPARRAKEKPGRKSQGVPGDPDGAPPSVGGKELTVSDFDTRGNVKPAIRKSLTNGETLLAFAQKQIEEKWGHKEWHPAVFLLMSSADPDLTYEQRALAARSVMPFFMPTLKSVEVKGDEENPLIVEVRETRRKMFAKLGMTDYLDEDGDLRSAEVEG